MNINFSSISERLADAFGDQEALVNIERNRRYTFTEFHHLTNQIVNMMREKLDLLRGDHAVVILDNDNASLMHWFTAAKGEATLCYTNYRDSIDDHAFQIDTVNASVVFIEADLLDSHYDMLREMQVTIVVMDAPEKDYPGTHCFWDLMSMVDDGNPDVVNDDRNDNVIIRFTGGTTGRGKCAMYCIDNLLMCKDSYIGLPDTIFTSQTRFLHLAPLTHGSGMMFLPTLFKGGCTLTMNQPNLESWCNHINVERITTSFVVPTLLYRLLDMDDVGRQRLETIDTLLYGAAPMNPSKLVGLQAVLGNIFVQVYGSTEHFAVALSLSRKDHLPVNGDESQLSSAGRPVPGVEIQIMDDDANKVARGEPGEIWLRSRAVVMGYLNSPEQTAAEFQDGFWKSGDVGRIDERGFFHVVDRKKDMIISGGFNIYANEIEAAISSHKSVLMTAVVGIPHAEWGEAVHAEVVLRDGGSVTALEVIAHVSDLLAGYKIPKTVQIVESLPVSAVGKVLRRRVREKYWVDTDTKVG